MQPVGGVDVQTAPRRTGLAWIRHAIVRLPYKPADHPYGYVVAIAGMIMQMINYGIGDNFSLYIKQMTADASLGYPSSTTLSYNNSVSLGLSPLFGLFIGWIADRVHPRIINFASTLLLFLGMWICASYANSPVFIIFTYSLFTSIASALMLSPGAASTGSWFEKRRAVGMGINFCGGALGNLVFPPTLRKWVLLYGWRKTMHLATSFCSLGLLATLLTCRRVNRESTSDEPLLRPQDSSSGEVDPPETTQTHYPDERASAMTAGSAHKLKMVSTATYVHAAGAESANGNDGVQRHHGGVESERSSFESMSVTHAMHTRLITPMETLRVFLTRDFLVHFFLFFVYGWGFYAFYYVYAQFVTVFGTEGTVYENVPALSNAEVNKVFVTFGVFEILGSVLVGCIAALTSNALTMVLCCVVSGAAMACLVLCRTYQSVMVCLMLVAFFKAGIFAVLPALINDSLHGPNLTFLMNCVFVSGSVGGFAAPPIHAQIVHHTHGNFSYNCIFMSVCITIPGYMCFFFLWKNKQCVLVRLWNQILYKRRSGEAVRGTNVYA